VKRLRSQIANLSDPSRPSGLIQVTGAQSEFGPGVEDSQASIRKATCRTLSALRACFLSRDATIERLRRHFQRKGTEAKSAGLQLRESFADWDGSSDVTPQMVSWPLGFRVQPALKSRHHNPWRYQIKRKLVDCGILMQVSCPLDSLLNDPESCHLRLSIA